MHFWLFLQIYPSDLSFVVQGHVYENIGFCITSIIFFSVLFLLMQI